MFDIKQSTYGLRLDIEGSTTDEIITELHRLHNIIKKLEVENEYIKTERKAFEERYSHMCKFTHERINKLESLKVKADEMALYYFKGEAQVGAVGPARVYLKAAKELDSE